MMTETKPEGITPSQTIGPFFHYMLTPKSYGFREIFTKDLATPDAAGQRIRVEGYVIDGDGEPIIDALVEIWQPDGEGRFASGTSEPGTNTAFTGFGRCEVDSNGFFSFDTVLPGRVAGPNGGLQAPHVDVGILARGVLRRLFTRIYFEGEEANASDPILALVPEDRRSTLVAKRTERGDHTIYTFNIRLQGENETVFFEN
jgi:protocatechuate 3,4-dioxygenase alpha subunit